MMKSSAKFAITALIVAGIVTSAISQTNPIVERKAIMKANGAAIGSLVKMVKGEAPFDAAAAKASLQTIHNTVAFSTLFPPGSDDGDTNALPSVWSNSAGFSAALAKLIAADEAQLNNPPVDVNGVKAALGAIGPTCSGCHNMFRAPS